jgi:hypothetical protein
LAQTFLSVPKKFSIHICLLFGLGVTNQDCTDFGTTLCHWTRLIQTLRQRLNGIILGAIFRAWISGTLPFRGCWCYRMLLLGLVESVELVGGHV